MFGKPFFGSYDFEAEAVRFPFFLKMEAQPSLGVRSVAENPHFSRQNMKGFGFGVMHVAWRGLGFLFSFNIVRLLPLSRRAKA